MATKNYVDLDMPIRGRCRKWERKAVCLSFDGSDDKVDCGADSSLNVAEITVEAWIYITTLQDSGIVNREEIWGYYNGTGQKGWAINLVYTNDLYFIACRASDGKKLNINYDNISANRWHHVVGVAPKGETIKLYLNGNLVAESNETLDGGLENYTAGSLLLGTSPGDNYFDGLIDEPRIYARAISEDEIKWNYMHKALGPKSTEGLVMRLPMNECVGKWAFDVSGCNNHGELFGPTWRDEVTVTDL